MDAAGMDDLDDAALWRAARSTMPPDQRERLADLHDEQDSRPLSRSEREEEMTLLALYHETILVRAQAVVLLKDRGYDVSDPTVFAPSE